MIMKIRCDVCNKEVTINFVIFKNTEVCGDCV